MLKMLYQAAGSAVLPVGLVWLAVWALALRCFLVKRIKEGLMAAGIACAIHAVGGTPLPSWLLARLERAYDPLHHPWPATADAVVMLGGTHTATPRSPLQFGVGEASDRILLALELMRTRRAGVLVLGGGQMEIGDRIEPEAMLLDRWIRSWKLPAGEIVVLQHCRDTHDEAVQTAELARQRGWKSVFLVTSGYHLPRGVALFEMQGVKVIPCGAEFLGLDALDAGNGWRLVPVQRGFELLLFWVHEEVASVYYRFRGWV
jgi:uncharacterized SAM-binding protein YcdF (DUF218 family)